MWTNGLCVNFVINTVCSVKSYMIRKIAYRWKKTYRIEFKSTNIYSVNDKFRSQNKRFFLQQKKKIFLLIFFDFGLNRKHNDTNYFISSKHETKLIETVFSCRNLLKSYVISDFYFNAKKKIEQFRIKKK